MTRKLRISLAEDDISVDSMGLLREGAVFSATDLWECLAGLGRSAWHEASFHHDETFTTPAPPTNFVTREARGSSTVAGSRQPPHFSIISYIR